MFKNNHSWLCSVCLLVLQLIITEQKRNIHYDTVLIWSLPPHNSAFHIPGAKSFKNAQCPEFHCYLTTNRTFLKTFTNFKTVLFFGVNLYNRGIEFYEALRTNRTSNQNYVYISQESPTKTPLCYKELDGFFNITFTFKLDSNVFYPFFIIKNLDEETIGPQENMYWIDEKEMEPIDNRLKRRLSNKQRAVAWRNNYCKGNHRIKYVNQLILALQKYKLTVDVYGKCGNIVNKFQNYSTTDFGKVLWYNYYFYLAFEDSLSEDYVTDTVLLPLQYYTVPIVYGGANYTRFLPGGSYLNAVELSPADLALEIRKSILNRRNYHNFFKWHNYYTYHHPRESPTTNPVCRFCNMVHDKEYMEMKKVVRDFRDWWNGPGVCYDEKLRR